MNRDVFARGVASMRVVRDSTNVLCVHYVQESGACVRVPKHCSDVDIHQRKAVCVCLR